MDSIVENIEKIASYPALWEFVKLVLVTLATILVLIVILRIERKIFKKFAAGKKSINARFLEDAARAVIIFVAVQWVVMSSPITQHFGRVLFQGTALVGAIAGLAAQPVISDLFCGLMISSVKPFNIGDRIELEDKTAGIVKDITLRHVVIQTIDTCQVIIPNSRLNSMEITNMSYRTHIRSIHFLFHVSYRTDVDKAKEVISKAIKESAYTIAGKQQGKAKEYGPVYFLAYRESSLELGTTVYFEPEHAAEVVKNDVNTRVKEALEAAGIEVPYSYMNVVMREETDGEKQGGCA